jgi:hypothetical protein
VTPVEDGPLGEWVYPNGSFVCIKDSGDDFYRNRGLGIVRLNRINNATSPTGQFCCVVPDATFTSTTTCIHIGEQRLLLSAIINFYGMQIIFLSGVCI